MELTFLGRGAGYNPEEGSTSAYFMANDELFLIDSGESVFRILLAKKLLDSVSTLNLFITHTHSDHVGSLGTLVLYASAAMKKKVNIIFDKNMDYLSNIKTLLIIFGLTEDMCHYVDSSEYDGKYSMFSKARYVKVKHTDELEACAILFETDQGLVFYSGDLNEYGPVVDVIKSGRQIDKIFVDTASDRNNLYHLSVHGLNDIVPVDLRSKIYCMHLNNKQCIEDALAYGFNVVSI